MNNKELMKIFEKIVLLCDKVCEEVIDDGSKSGTGGILSACANVVLKIEDYMEKD